MTPKRTDWRPRFLEAFRNSGNVRAACQAAGISRQTAYRNRSDDDAFAAQWREAEDDAIDILEAIATQRAKTTSDTLLIFLLKAHRPAKYRETTRTELTGLDGGPITSRALTEGLDDHERIALRDAIDRELARRVAARTEG